MHLFPRGRGPSQSSHKIVFASFRGREPSQSSHSFACKQAKRDIFASRKVGFLFPASPRNFHVVEIRYLPWNTANILSLGWRNFKNALTLEPQARTSREKLTFYIIGENFPAKFLSRDRIDKIRCAADERNPAVFVLLRHCSVRHVAEIYKIDL